MQQFSQHLMSLSYLFYEHVLNLIILMHFSNASIKISH